MPGPMHHVFEFTPESLRLWCSERGMAAYRADQILEWVYRRGVIDPAEMSNLPGRERELLTREMSWLSGRVLTTQAASDGTRKLLIEWIEETPDQPDARSEARLGTDPAREVVSMPLPVLSDSASRATNATGVPPAIDGSSAASARQTECVMIPADEHRRRTACISSQVGCPVGCRFCASGIGGLDGNLSAGRIVEQVWRLRHLARTGSADEAGMPVGSVDADGSSCRITNVVFMGMGEPLANFAAVLHAARTLAAPWGMGIGARRITISTVGLPRAIERLADELELPVTLALSLHAPNDELRRTLIPWAQYTSIPDLLGACRKWFEKTGREITLEYILLGGVNDRPEHAGELAGVARSLRANVNLIRYNEVAGLPYQRPRSGDVRRFQEILRRRGVNSHIRASRGRDIAAACGQLRHEKTSAP